MCGFRGAFVNRENLPFEETEYRPDITVDDFTRCRPELLRLIVVPKPEANQLFVPIDERILDGFAVVVAYAGAEGAVGNRASPLPAGHHVHAAAEIDFFTKMHIDGRKRSAAQSGRASGTVVGTELEFEWFGSAVGLHGPADFSVEAKVFNREVTQARKQRISHVVDALETGIADQEFIANV